MIARGSRNDRPDYDYLDRPVLEVFGSVSKTVQIVTPDGEIGAFSVQSDDHGVTASGPGSFSVRVAGRDAIASEDGRVRARW